jgi:hypothetical protein
VQVSNLPVSADPAEGGFQTRPYYKHNEYGLCRIARQKLRTEAQNFGPLSKPIQRPYTMKGGRIWHESLGELKQCPCEKESYHEAGILVQPMNAIEK